MVFSHARVLMVREERLSAAARDRSPASASARGACSPRSGSTSRSAPSPWRCSRLFALADSWLTVIGYRSQLVALVLFEAFVAARIALRLWLLAVAARAAARARQALIP